MSSSDNGINDSSIPLKTKRRSEIEFEPQRLCSIGSVKELNDKVLKTQHYKLCERFRLNEKLRGLLEKRIEEHETKQAQDDAVLCIVNSYWNKLDEDVQLLLQRFDADGSIDDDKARDSKNFLNILSEWTYDETDERMKQRVEFSQRAISKLIRSFDRIVQQNEKICSLLQPPVSNDETEQQNDSDKVEIVTDELKRQTVEVLRTNSKLQNLINRLQSENRQLSLKTSRHDDEIGVLESKIDNITNELEDVRYQLQKSLTREEKVEYRLAEYLRKESQALNFSSVNKTEVVNGISEELVNVTKAKLDELQQKLDDQTALSNSRFSEIQELVERNKLFSAELERCQIKTNHVQVDSIKDSTEYRSLQSAFSNLLDDSKALRREVDGLKHQVEAQKQAGRDQFENMKADETSTLKRMDDIVLELESDLNLLRTDRDKLAVENEQLKASKDQSGLLHEQVLTHMKSYSNQNSQLKKDVSRFKRKWQESTTSLTCQKELEHLRRITGDHYIVVKLDDKNEKEKGNGSVDVKTLHSLGTSSPMNFYQNNASLNVSGSDSPLDEKNSTIKNEYGDQMEAIGEGTSATKQEPPISPNNLQKDQIQQLTLERDKLKDKIRAMARMDLKEKRKLMTDETRRKMRQLEEQCEKLKRELASAKQEEDGLMTEMESTGMALEDVQEQNQKLTDQLREKDDLNLRMMSERIRLTHAQKKAKEERDMIEHKLVALENQLAAKSLLCEKLEEKERYWNENRAHYEHELRLRDQANESLKRKATEAAQVASDLRLRLERLTEQYNEIQETMVKKAAAYEENTMKINRLQEEKNALKRKLERAKRMEKYENMDELLQEENKQLKQSLTCPICKVHPKNAVLAKCCHVFCFTCLKKRYDHRQRKCPRCNCPFGANDFRRVYIE